MGNRTTQLNNWFQTALGKRLLSEEAGILQQILPHLFGYHLLQIGNLGHGTLLESSRIMHRCILSRSHANMICQPYSSVYALADTLPFAHDSLDVVVLPHVLEFEEHPHEILREVERVLIAEGHVVILAFNPVSLWGIWRWFTRRDEAPWCGHFLPLLRLKDWLALLGFDLKKVDSFFFALPFQNDRFKNYTQFLETIGTRRLDNFGAVYVVVAKKRVTTITPIKPKWLTKPKLVAEAVGTNFKGHNSQ
jgi:SAM-dependent methyltransferase